MCDTRRVETKEHPMNTKCTRYLVRGSVRGTISTNHRTISGAVRSCERDRKQCAMLGGGAYSDAGIERVDGEPLTQDELEEIERIEDMLRGY